MYIKPLSRTIPLLLIVAALALSGCASVFDIASSSGTAPTPIEISIQGGEDDPDVFVDPAAFRTALLEALNAGDQDRLRLWMSEPFLTGVWRGELSETSPADALQALLAEELDAGHRLELVENVDLKALIGGVDPLSIPRGDAGVVDAFLVGGWGADGRDEALLFVARQADNSLKLHGWMVVEGGFR